MGLADYYCFYITTKSGEVVIWTNLTRIAARTIFNATERNPPDNCKETNWGKMPPAPGHTIPGMKNGISTERAKYLHSYQYTKDRAARKQK